MQMVQSKFQTPKHELQQRQFAEMLAEDGHDSLPATFYGLDRIFRGIDLCGKRVLEIGSGRGLMAIYSALGGAKRVVSMEPELAGSSNSVITLQKERIAQLRLDSVEVVMEDFNTWDAGGETFDVILSLASINHIHESRCHAMRDEATRNNYLRIIRKLRALLNPGGTVVVTDACRYGFWSWAKHVGVRRPWRWRKSSIDWRVHQNPGVWKQLFCEAGFLDVEITYPVPYALSRLEPVLDSKCVNFFLYGTFILHCHG